MGVIYKITNPSGGIYVGQTVNYENRLKRYRWKACKKQRYLYNSFLKYGFDSHVFEILEANVSEDKLNEREVFWINETKSFYRMGAAGMNLNLGGNTPVWDKNRIEDFSSKFKGEKNPFYGKTHTAEVRKIFSENAKKQMQTQKPTRLATEKGAAAKMRSIITYDKSGSFLFEYPSLTAVAKSMNVDVTTIRDALRSGGWVKKTLTCRYKTDGYPMKIAV